MQRKPNKIQKKISCGGVWGGNRREMMGGEGGRAASGPQQYRAFRGSRDPHGER